MKKYESLKEEFSEYITLNQLYQICKISKRSARYLIQNGIIPCVQNDNKTWRYRISIDDVITYLRRREQVGSMIPRGAVKNGNKAMPVKPKKMNNEVARLIQAATNEEIKRFLRAVYSITEDALTTTDVSRITGFHISTVRKDINSGALQSLQHYRQYIIPLEYLCCYVKTDSFLQHTNNTQNEQNILRGYEIWKTAKS